MKLAQILAFRLADHRNSQHSPGEATASAPEGTSTARSRGSRESGALPHFREP